MPVGKGGVGTWTDNGTDATITLGNNAVGQDHYKTIGSCPANGTITMSIDVKSVLQLILYCTGGLKAPSKYSILLMG